MANTDATGTTDTTDAIGTKGKAVPAPVPATVPDTTEAGRVAAHGWTPQSTLLTGTRDTQYGLVTDVNPKYKAPPLPPPGVNVDTTHTDSPTSDGSGGLTPDVNLELTGTIDTTSIGAQPLGTTAVPTAPSAPTVVAGDRYLTVSWSLVSNPGSDAKVTGYVVESDNGGHAQAAANATSVRFDTVVGGRSYKFRVRAQNRNGDGAWSPFSASGAVPTNSDEVAVGSLTAANKVNPIYNEDGTIKPGSYGAPTAPGKPTVVAKGGSSGTATVTWTAPSSGQPSGGYTVKASSGQSVHVAGTVVTADLPGLTVSQVVTVTVTAIGQLQSAVSPASNNYTVV